MSDMTRGAAHTKSTETPQYEDRKRADILKILKTEDDDVHQVLLTYASTVQ
jgi:hypothetical protein